MNVDRFVMAFAGTLIILSVALSLLINSWWLLLTGFVGLNLLQAAFTGFCPLALVLKRLGIQSGNAF